ncbi:hypothetical protein QMK19_34250 [Streptomyces sp. H10-C2]|uniref:hypothetical protein n=1 Tax=unclassified Streptomyces TaxID=2593676 RepID=UPI0024BB0E92|nr:MULTISPECIES: hypothetical protein [unclassified Streptomyces]MDJ0345699.1 hypothetical protein [Streptomyces sp. PH10-H1]MDJ0374551.1 hypothetical protein [Streptomyces sp. H10-C2]
MTRIRALLAALVLSAAMLLGGGAPASQAVVAPVAFQVTGVDLHDGMLTKDGATFVLTGTMYGCGFTWQTDGTPFCGFGVSTAPSLAGPWSTPKLLFDPKSTINAQSGWTRNAWTWQQLCGHYGAGCFNARLVQRPDGVWLLAFNAPADYNIDHSNAYYVMGCNSSTGPCGTQAGPPYGSTHKPSLTRCIGNGDFAIIGSPAAGEAIECSLPGASGLNIELLDKWWSNGTGAGQTNLANLGQPNGIEGPGAFQDPATGLWVSTYSDPMCGYCAGVATGYATSPNLLGPWTAPTNLAAAGLPVAARRDISAGSCGGQPRTVSVIDGQAYQGIDLWTGTRNQTAAGLLFVPLTMGTPSGTAGDGQVWRPPLTLAC